MKIRSLTTAAGALAMVAVGCGVQPPPEPGLVQGALTVSIQLSPAEHDVSAVRFDVVASDTTCDGTALATKTVTASDARWSSAPGSAPRQVADGLFLLPAGDYRVCATPLGAAGAPSQDCARAEAPATIAAEQTNEVMLVSQCRGSGSGGLGAVAILNSPPRILAVTADPSRYITVCQAATLTAVALDPDGDAPSLAWSVVAGPGASTLTAAGAAATFSTRVPGAYTLGVTASDVHGAKASLTFALHVSPAACAVPPAIQAILVARCSPCHTAAASGGLSLATAEASFANLVDRAAAGAGCTERVRVVRGDPAGSYLMAKLRNLPPLCGAPMPRGRPSLPDAELQALEEWIAALPR